MGEWLNPTEICKINLNPNIIHLYTPQYHKICLFFISDALGDNSIASLNIYVYAEHSQGGANIDRGSSVG